jgi:DNA (cytosine-5)-methyltransferase 1
VSDTQLYWQFGNAVVVPVVEFVAKAVKSHLIEAIKPEHDAQRAFDLRVANG